MEYLLKVSTVVAIFYLSYKILLQQETFFEKNRWFLLAGLFTAFLLPLVIIPIYVEATPLDFSNYGFKTTHATQNIEKPFYILDYLSFIYGLGILFFSARFLVQFTSLAFLIFRNNGTKNSGFTFVKTTDKVSPFSFFHWIVYNPEQFNSIELEQIITHEKVHANQFHSFDILLTNLCCIVLWFNPFMWFYNKDLKQNLEFIADKIAATKTNCKKSYQYTLLKTSMPSHQMALINPFYNSLIKKRIVMLHKSKSKKINQIKYALVIPILAAFLMSFNTEEVYIELQKPSIETFKENDVLEVVISKIFTDSDLENLQTKLKQEGYTANFKSIKRNNKNEITAIEIDVTSKSSKANYIIESDEAINPIKIRINNNDISIGNSNLLKEKHVVITSNDEENDENKVVLPNCSKKAIVISSDTDEDTSKNEEIIIEKAVKTVTSGDKEPLYILNGKEITKDVMNSIDPNYIKKVEVIKDADATKLYGKKGKNGVVLITTKNDKLVKQVIVEKTFDSISKKVEFSNQTLRLNEKALYKIDGKEVKKAEVDELNPNNIKSVNVYKGSTAIEKFGQKGKNGIVEITTKK